MEEEECDTHWAWCHGKTGQDSETHRWYMFLIWLYKGRELTNWYKLFSLAVRHFNTVPHQFSPIPPKHLSDALTQCTV